MVKSKLKNLLLTFYTIRRLEQVLQEGKKIQYIAASATIGNLVEFTSKMFNRDMVHVDCKTPKKNTTQLYIIQRKMEVRTFK